MYSKLGSREKTKRKKIKTKTTAHDGTTNIAIKRTVSNIGGTAVVPPTGSANNNVSIGRRVRILIDLRRGWRHHPNGEIDDAVTEAVPVPQPVTQELQAMIGDQPSEEIRNGYSGHTNVFH